MNKPSEKLRKVKVSKCLWCGMIARYRGIRLCQRCEKELGLTELKLGDITGESLE